MDDHAIVLNAGSSSLKFSIYRRPEAANRGGGASAPLWGVDLRGQIDGIGTSPRFTAKDGSDARVADDRLAQGLDGRGAFDALASWLRARYGGGARVLGVGHRVVHGGAKYGGPTRVTTEVLTDLRARGIGVVARCPFVVAWLQRHPERQDILVEPLRARDRPGS